MDGAKGLSLSGLETIILQLEIIHSLIYLSHGYYFSTEDVNTMESQ